MVNPVSNYEDATWIILEESGTLNSISYNQESVESNLNVFRRH